MVQGVGFVCCSVVAVRALADVSKGLVHEENLRIYPGSV